jgi:hypothetical protein
MNETKQSPPAPHTTALPPLMSLSAFCKAFGISKSLFYKLPLEQRPRVVRVGSKPLIRAEDALTWAANLPEVER